MYDVLIMLNDGSVINESFETEPNALFHATLYRTGGVLIEFDDGSAEVAMPARIVSIQVKQGKEEEKEMTEEYMRDRYVI